MSLSISPPKCTNIRDIVRTRHYCNNHRMFVHLRETSKFNEIDEHVYSNARNLKKKKSILHARGNRKYDWMTCSSVLKNFVFTHLNLNNSSRGHFSPRLSTKMALTLITNVAPTCRVTSTPAQWPRFSLTRREIATWENTCKQVSKHTVSIRWSFRFFRYTM